MSTRDRAARFGRILLLCAVGACLFPGDGFASRRAKVTLPSTRPLTLDCVVKAAQINEVPLAALLGILATEGGKSGEALSNTNGTWDMGPFQINTCHLNELGKLGVSPGLIMTDGCVNALAAGWLLRKELNRSQTIWEAMGAYHSRTPRFHYAYIKRVRNNLAKLTRTGVATLIEYANGHRRSWR